MSDYILQTDRLTKQYGQSKAVDNVNMTIRKGDIYGFIGSNRAGKTTLIRLITSLIRPTSGSISLFGNETPKDHERARKRIGALIDGPAFFPKLSARDNLEYYRIQRGIPNKQVVDKALLTVNLMDEESKRYHQFSLGMKQKLGIALAIMGKPDFLILDEPTNGLDPTSIIEFREIIKRLHDENNMTILISSHMLSELMQVATTYGIIHKGSLLKEFTQAQLEEETRKYISVRVDNVALATTILQEKLNTQNFEVFPHNELRVYSYLDNPAAVNVQLCKQGVIVSAVTEMGTNLEDYFMQMLEKHSRRETI